MPNSNDRIITLTALAIILIGIIGVIFQSFENKPEITNVCIKQDPLENKECISNYYKILGFHVFYVCGESSTKLGYISIMVFNSKQDVVGENSEIVRIPKGKFCQKIGLYHLLTYDSYSIKMMYKHIYYPILDFIIE